MRQPEGELYAAVCIESQRAGTYVVGEDLRHGAGRGAGAHGASRRGAPLRSPVRSGAPSWVSRTRCRRGAVASLNTHDMPTFSGYLKGTDLEARRELRAPRRRSARRERATRISNREHIERFFSSRSGSSSGRRATRDSAVRRARHAGPFHGAVRAREPRRPGLRGGASKRARHERRAPRTGVASSGSPSTRSRGPRKSIGSSGVSRATGRYRSSAIGPFAPQPDQLRRNPLVQRGDAPPARQEARSHPARSTASPARRSPSGPRTPRRSR